MRTAAGWREEEKGKMTKKERIDCNWVYGEETELKEKQKKKKE